MSDVFDSLKKSIEKNVKGAHVSVLSESNIATERTWVKTPARDLNRILSGSVNKGIQTRNLVGIVGPEHTMKSSFMTLCMVEGQKNNMKPIIIDTEGGITKDFCRRWGLDPDNILYIYTPWIHEVKSILGQIRNEAEEDYIIGLDSAGGLDRYKSLEDAVKGDPKADQGLLQKEIRGMLKLFLNICIAQNSLGIVCGHMYGSPSSVPMPDQIGGGKAMRLFPSILISLKKEQMREDPSVKSSKVIGNRITATTLKNRAYPPFQTATVELDYEHGINEFAGMIELATNLGLVEKSGSWYSYKGERLGQGVLNATETLKNMGDDFFKEIDKCLESTGYSSVNEQIKEAEKLLEETGSIPEAEPEPEKKKKK